MNTPRPVPEPVLLTSRSDAASGAPHTDPPGADQPADPPPHDSGQTTPQAADGRAPRLPHERDESSDSQQTMPQPVMQQAAEDLQRGLQDTDRGPVMDEVYEHHVRPGGGATRDRGKAQGPP